MPVEVISSQGDSKALDWDQGEGQEESPAFLTISSQNREYEL
jgi:hypothetical protein